MEVLIIVLTVIGFAIIFYGIVKLSRVFDTKLDDMRSKIKELSNVLEEHDKYKNDTKEDKKED